VKLGILDIINKLALPEKICWKLAVQFRNEALLLVKRFNFQAKEKRAFKDLCQITPLQAIFV